MPPIYANALTRRKRALAWGRFVLSAAVVASALHLAVLDPLVAMLVVSVALGLALPQLRARRRLRDLLSSGDIHAILEVSSDAAESHPDYRTNGPLARAAALAAHGMTERARSALDRAERGQAWEHAIEHRLFIQALLHAFEGETEEALRKAATLRSLPMPASPWAKSKAASLRHGLAALTRAFAHRPQAGDERRLAAAAKYHPLVHWAMRYAQAILCIDRGAGDKALRLIEGAPPWPEESAFHAFHDELEKVAQRCTSLTRTDARVRG